MNDEPTKTETPKTKRQIREEGHTMRRPIFEDGTMREWPPRVEPMPAVHVGTPERDDEKPAISEG